MENISITLDGYPVLIYKNGNNGPIFIGAGASEDLVSMVKTENRDITLVVFEVRDWNRELSVWKASGVFDEDFQGDGEITKQWVLASLLPYLKENVSYNGNIYYFGYSLSGLFALWMATKDRECRGAVSCSGSLWFEGFTDYMKDTNFISPKRFYLSLGGKEEKTSHPVISRVGDCTRQIQKILSQKENVLDCILVMNAGGHFNNPAGRIWKGITRMLDLDR